VDDEPAVLDGLRRQLRRSFDVVTATSGAEALQLLADDAGTDGPGTGFAAVISDMRMPQMDGATLLTQVRASWPDTTRLLLTGHSDMDAAVAAINHGQIFRFLTKPCPIETVTSCLHDAVNQHRLIVGERELLELTLRGCIQALTDCLSLANPIAFARAARVRDLVTGLAGVLEVSDPWVPEVAAVLSQLGAVVLPDSVADKLHRGAPLAPSEQTMANRLPAIAEQVLARIRAWTPSETPSDGRTSATTAGTARDPPAPTSPWPPACCTSPCTSTARWQPAPHPTTS
jgi:response regulator RpfG family c-di-GMP phosphodiesterase